MSNHELVLRRHLKAPRMALWRCWCEPELLMQWFCPKPWRVSKAVMDPRAGGASEITMSGPNGEEFPNRGVYLEVVPGERLVFTDAYVKAWEPSEKPFMTAVVTFADASGGGTDYVATCHHWSAADCEQHVKMGFHEGWGKAADQLEELALTLK